MKPALPTKESLGQRLARLMGERGCSQKQLSEALGISAAAVCDWLKTQRIPRDAQTLIRLSEYFNVSIDFLVSGKSISRDLNDPPSKTEGWARYEVYLRKSNHPG